MKQRKPRKHDPPLRRQAGESPARFAQRCLLMEPDSIALKKIDDAFDRLARPKLLGEQVGPRKNKHLATLAKIRRMERTEETDW